MLSSTMAKILSKVLALRLKDKTNKKAKNFIKNPMKKLLPGNIAHQLNEGYFSELSKITIVADLRAELKYCSSSLLRLIL